MPNKKSKQLKSSSPRKHKPATVSGKQTYEEFGAELDVEQLREERKPLSVSERSAWH